jgi:2-amino-4-hydroxy-6-hydroxymethyldihydropteridine diphosphokinase
LNATDTIFALALASNHQPELHFRHVYAKLQSLGQLHCSSIYLIPCRDGVGADYWNAACLLKTQLKFEQVIAVLKTMEMESGRVRPSHKISLDIDLIAWGQNLTQMQFNPEKLPLALDVKIPLYELWQAPDLAHPPHAYPNIELESH